MNPEQEFIESISKTLLSISKIFGDNITSQIEVIEVNSTNGQHGPDNKE